MAVTEKLSMNKPRTLVQTGKVGGGEEERRGKLLVSMRKVVESPKPCPRYFPAIATAMNKMYPVKYSLPWCTCPHSFLTRRLSSYRHRHSRGKTV